MNWKWESRSVILYIARLHPRKMEGWSKTEYQSKNIGKIYISGPS